MAPPSSAGEVAKAAYGRFRYNREIGALLEMRRRAVQTIDERGAHGARLLHVQIEHKAVDYQSVQAVSKKIGQCNGTHGLSVSQVGCPFFKTVVFGNLAAERQFTAQNGDLLHPLSQITLRLKKPISGRTVSTSLAGKSHRVGTERCHRPS